MKFVDVRFCDLPGVMQHFTVPVEAFDPAEELAFDGSSIRGFQAIHESDMALRADLSTARVDPFRKDKTVNINFFIHDPITGEQYSRDPRNVAKKAEAYLASTGIADTAYFGPEAEFYVFDSVRFETKSNESFYHIDSEAGAWNTGALEDNRGYKVRYKGGYFPAPPVDHFADLRAEISLELNKAGLQVERQHHEVGTAGQAEINYRFNTLLAAADDLMLFKYIVKNVAWRNGKTATFMPKPIFGDNGSGMHVHQSLWSERHPALLRRGGLRGPVGHRPLLHRRHPQARAVAAGVHQPDGELLPPPGPRLRGPGQPGLLAAQPLRGDPDPDHRSNPKAKRIEFRAPDPSSNPYLAFSALLLAGLDGIKNKIEPAEPIDKDLYELAPEEHANVPQVPTSLPAVLDALEADHEYLLQGGVFTPDLIETWIDFKRTAEIAPIQLRPHPHEFELYFDV